MTSLFQKYPTVQYDGRILCNIAIRLDFINRIKNNVSLFQFINLSDNDRPEDIAQRYFGDSELFWIVLMLNDIVNPYYEWLLSEDRFNEYVEQKYGLENIGDVHHYETTDASDFGAGVIVDAGEPFSTPISNYTHEQRLNEARRKIKIIKIRYIPQILAEYQNELQRIQ